MKRVEKKKYWQDTVEKFEGSNLSARAFCQQENLSYANLLRWRKCFAQTEEACPRQLHFDEILPLQKISLSSGSLVIQVETIIDFDSLSLVIGALCKAASR